jgi:hypothetical protein
MTRMMTTPGSLRREITKSFSKTGPLHLQNGAAAFFSGTIQTTSNHSVSQEAQ